MPTAFRGRAITAGGHSSRVVCVAHGQRAGGRLAGRGAPRRGVVDPRATREELSVILLGHRPYLEAERRRGKVAWPERRVAPETAQGQACQDPDGTVKARLPEPKCPTSKCQKHGYSGLTSVGFSRKRQGFVSPPEESGIKHTDSTRSGEAGPPIAAPRTRNGHLTRPERQLRTKRGIP